MNFVRSKSLIFLLALCLLPLVVVGQSNRGRITGQVTDSSGGAIPGAKIIVENLGTHVARTLTSNGEGNYFVPDVDPGFYSLRAEAANFKPVVRDRIQVEVANDIRIDFQLQPGLVSEVVEIKEEAPVTQTSDAVLSGVLSNQAINELPLQGRDFQNLLALHPGVQREPGGGFHTLTSNGLRPDDNNFIIDGATDNDAYYGETVMNDAGISGTPASHLPLDAIQEFDTQEQPGADFGAKPGVVVNIGIKSGTDQVHGTAYYYNRNNVYDARNYFNPSPQPFSALNLHQFGASIGGPIVKGKLFYFANYEGVRDKVGNPYLAYSPVTSSLVGRVDPDSLDYPLDNYSIVDALNTTGCGQVPLPPTCSQLSVNLTKLFLTNPGFTALASDPSAINFDFNNQNREDNVVFKMDYNINEHNKLSGRYIYANSHQIEEDAVPIRSDWLSETFPVSQVFGIDWTYIPNSHWVNDLRFSYNRFSEFIGPVDQSVSYSSYGLNTGITNPSLGGFPRINPGRHVFNYMGGNSSWPLATTPSGTYNYSDTATFLAGKHTFRFGGSYTEGHVNYYRSTYGRGRVDFDNLDDFLTGTVDSWRLLYGDPGRNIRMSAVGLFVQDDFKVSRRLTLNLGLRYDITYPIKDANNELANYSPTQGIVQVGYGINHPYQTNFNNVSPRLGAAWDIFGSGKTVLRAGFGMIYVEPAIRTFVNSAGLNLNPSGIPKVMPDGTVIAPTGTITSYLLTGADPSLINWNTTGPIFPTANPSLNQCSYDLPCTIFGVDQHLKTPYVLNWNLNLQQAITNSSVLQIAYVANHGVKLYSTVDINQVDPALDDGYEQLGRPLVQNCPASDNGSGLGGPCYPYLGFLNYLGNKSTSTYNALQVTYTKRYSHGFYLLAGYTYGHAIDTTSGTTNLASVPQNSLDFAAEKARGDYDIRHRFTLSLTYDLPSIKSKLQMLEGWELTTIFTAQTGEPINIYDDGDDLTLTGEGAYNDGWDRWNIKGDPKKLKWSSSSTIPFLSPDDPTCLSVATTPELLDALNYAEGCYAQKGVILYPNAFGTFGNMGRNIFQGPGFVNWDMSVLKNWNLNEKLKLQFRGEVFNVLNHPNFANGSIGNDLYDPSSFGQAAATPDVQAANPVVGSGGSRHIQLGLKLIW
jgi:hypothetical protein